MTIENKSEKVQYASVKSISAQYFPIDLLEEMIPTYFIPWAEKGYIKNSKEVLKDLKANFHTKDLLLDIFTQFVLDKECFDKAYNDMSEVVKAVFIETVWKGGGDIEELYKKYKVNIKTSSLNAKARVLMPEFRMFRSDFQFKGMQVGPITIDVKLIPFLRRVVPKPYEAELHNVEKIDAKYIKNYEIEAVENIAAYLEMKRSGDTKITSAGKPLKASLTRFEKYAKIEEFYEETTDEYLINAKKELVIKIMEAYRAEILKEKSNPIEMLKEFLNKIFNSEAVVDKGMVYKQATFSLVKTLHPNIKGIRKDEEVLDAYLPFFKKILIEMGKFSWVTTENVCDYIVYNEIMLLPYSISFIQYYLKLEDRFSGGVNDIHFRDYGTVYNYLFKPFIQGMMFFMASFGMVEIAYNSPEKSKEIATNDGFVSCFDGLEYVKLTDLGKYILSLTKEYNAYKENEDKMSIELSESELLITTIGEDKLKKILISKIAAEISDGIYRVTYQSLFSDCATSVEVKDKIEDFKKRIAGKLPDNWNDFFEVVESKFTPIEQVADIVVFKLKQDMELINFIAKNEEAKKIVYKAEGYHILVEKKNLNKLKKILAESGYFSD